MEKLFIRRGQTLDSRCHERAAELEPIWNHASAQQHEECTAQRHGQLGLNSVLKQFRGVNSDHVQVEEQDQASTEKRRDVVPQLFYSTKTLHCSTKLWDTIRYQYMRKYNAL